MWPGAKPHVSHSAEEDWFCAQDGSRSAEPVRICAKKTSAQEPGLRACARRPGLARDGRALDEARANLRAPSREHADDLHGVAQRGVVADSVEPSSVYNGAERRTRCVGAPTRARWRSCCWRRCRGRPGVWWRWAWLMASPGWGRRQEGRIWHASDVALTQSGTGLVRAGKLLRFWPAVAQRRLPYRGASYFLMNSIIRTGIRYSVQKTLKPKAQSDVAGQFSAVASR
jgi:hypothetical protein